MKLLIVLSVIACGYADKLDRTYLPPAGAGSSGGSPGSLNTPLGPSGFGQPAGFGQAGASGFNNGAGSAFGQSGSNGFGAQSNQYQAGSGQAAGAGFGGSAQGFGNQAQDYQRSQSQRAQASAEQTAEILRSDSQNDGETFSYSFETSNGISAEESGVATNGVQAQGAFAYSSDDGQTFRVQYTADENGYQPQGDHLPTSPPIPDEILKSIEENAKAAAAGTQEGAYNPDEDNNEVSQQYSSNAPTSYNQAPTGQSGFNQAAKSPVTFYGTPNAPSQQYNAGFGASNGGAAGGFNQQGSSQQYNAGSGAPSGGAARPLNGFGSQGSSPSQMYGSPSNSAGNGVASGFNQQGSPQQYNAGSRVPSGGAARPSNGFGSQGSSPSQLYGSSSNGAGNGASRPNGFNQQGPSAPQQYQASPSGQFSSAGRPQGSSQAQDASGYQYKPQDGFGGSNNGPAQQYSSQSGAPSGPQRSTRPSGNAFPSSGANGQESFGASPNSQASYGSAPTSKSQGSFAPSGSNAFSGPKSPSPFGSNGQTSYGASASPNSAFGPFSGSQPGSNGFGGPQDGSGSNGQGFSRPQFQAPSAKSPTSDAGYEYNRPSGNSQFGGSQSQNGNGQFGGSMLQNANGQFRGSQPQNSNAQFGGSQNGFKSADQGRPGQFGAPRAPPSFSEEAGYKY